MAQKRKFEEYHDPDYPENVNEKVFKLSTENNDSKIDKEKRICDIVTRELQNEINNKEREVYEINNRICIVRKTLHKLCYAIISNYYNKRHLNIDSENIERVQKSVSNLFTNDTKGVQHSIHPSLKKILGSNEINYKELLNNRPTRQAAKTAQTTIKEKFKTKKEMRLERLKLKYLENIQENITVDESSKEIVIVNENLENLNNETPTNTIKEEPDSNNRWDKAMKLNTDRGVNLSKYLVAVGNTSKFIKKESVHDKVTHRWLIYVKSQTETTIEKFVKKVRFYLHPSYKPNDIIDIDSAPFQLAHKGWGEFPVRIQLYFHSKFQQKPVQFYHNLVLDKTLSGLETMGSETLVELWLRSNLISPIKPKIQSPTNSCQDWDKDPFDHISIKQENLTSQLKGNNDNIIDFINQIDSSFPSDLDSIEPTLILSPTTHTKLKFAEAICSPTFQNKCTDNYIPIKQEPSIDNYCDDYIYLNENLGNYNVNYLNNKNLKKSETVTKFSNKSVGDVPINIKKINEKLIETIKTETITNEICVDKILFEENIKNEAQSTNTTFNNTAHLSSNSVQHKNQIILKDGIVNIIDPHQPKFKKKTKQISLLKPVIKNSLAQNKKQKFENISLLDHDYTSPWKDEITVIKEPKSNEIDKDNINNIVLPKTEKDIKDSDMISNDDFISVVISDNTKQLVNLKKKITLTVRDESFSKNEPFVDYRGKFEIKFHTIKFISEINLVEYCLKKVPLINLKATDINYQTAFPFVVKDIDTLTALSIPKQRALEWLQCKYFSTLMKNHDQFKEAWSTKEIILYARFHGFSPTPLIYNISSNNMFNISQIHNDDNTVKNLMNNEIDEKPIQSINEIYEWINNFSNKIENDPNISKINIDDVCNDDDDDNKLNKVNIKFSSPIKYEENSIILPIKDKFRVESNLIKQICSEIDIRLNPEEIFEGVHLNASEFILIKIFRKFLENLIRKSIFEAKSTNDLQSNPVIQVEHVKLAILSNPDFEFLNGDVYKNVKIKEEEDPFQ